jgi:hypothetical protein
MHAKIWPISPSSGHYYRDAIALMTHNRFTSAPVDLTVSPMLDGLEPTISRPPAVSSAPVVSSAPAQDPAWVRAALWGAIAVFVIALSAWVWDAGLRIRHDAWVYSRTIRFHNDIANGLRWGNLVLRTSERLASNDNSPIKANANPDPNAKDQRPLTFWEKIRGLDQVYQDLVTGEPPDANYGLDYPPMRLFVMTLWASHVQEKLHDLPNWPGPWQLKYSATGDPRELENEDIATPLLLVNTMATAGAAVISFFLVWVWANRGGRPWVDKKLVHFGPKPWCWFPRRSLVPWKPVTLRQSSGLLLFPVTAVAFFYAIVIAEAPVPAPPPTISIAARPILVQAGSNTSAGISGEVNPQGGDTQWFVEWGTDVNYGNSTSPESVGSGGSDVDVSATLTNLPPKALIHYRLVARNDQSTSKDDEGRGTTRTQDETFSTDPNVASPTPSMRTYGDVWLEWPQWVGVGVIFVAMMVSLRILPPVHRGWACGLVGALLLWLDPSLIVDSHIWPQWDPWVLPPFLLAALMASLDLWFLAGLVLGVGVMFKGQTLVTAPVLAMWPLLALQWGRLGRMVVGFVLAAGLILSPWLSLGNEPPHWAFGAPRWILGVMAATMVAAALSLYRRPLAVRLATLWVDLKGEFAGDRKNDAEAPVAATAVFVHSAAPATSLFHLIFFALSLLTGMVVVTVLVLRRWPIDSELPRIGGLFLLLAILIPPWFLKRGSMVIWIAAILASTLWMSAYLYHGDWAWKTVGFEYGARKFTRMALGAGTNGNLPKILETRFGWDVHDPAMTLRLPDLADMLHLGHRLSDGSIDGWAHDWGFDGTPVVLDILALLKGVFVVALLACGVGMAVSSRRNNPRVLAGLAAAWIMMTTILCQMASRYQIWGAAVTCLLVGVAPELLLLHILASVIAAGMVGAQMMNSDPSRSPQILDLFNKFAPDDGWLLVFIGLACAYMAIVPGSRAKPEELAW